MKKTLKSGSPSEDAIQKTFFEWVFAQENVYPDLKLLHHIPNGGSRNIIEAKKLKAMGVRKGVPDCFLPVPMDGYHGLYIEFKSEKGELSTDQAQKIHRLMKRGYFVAIFYEPIGAIALVKKYLGIR